LVACGYCQIPGIDFHEISPPVINNVCFGIMLIAKLMWGLNSYGDFKLPYIVDVETAMRESSKCMDKA
jgi:hypothetical protein